MGALLKVTVTLNAPQNCYAAEPETLSYQSGVEDEAGTNTDVVILGCGLPYIVADEHGGLMYV